jgi:uncharacterized protein YdeI (YjbR/CyaY-like superfamily)
MRYGGVDYIGLNREVRDAARLSAGDKVVVHIEADTETREVEVPPELAKLLADDTVARNAFDKLSYTHRKEYAGWIAEAKREDTRERRLARAAQMLRSGVRTPG